MRATSAFESRSTINPIMFVKLISPIITVVMIAVGMEMFLRRWNVSSLLKSQLSSTAFRMTHRMAFNRLNAALNCINNIFNAKKTVQREAFRTFVSHNGGGRCGFCGCKLRSSLQALMLFTYSCHEMKFNAPNPIDNLTASSVALFVIISRLTKRHIDGRAGIQEILIIGSPQKHKT